MEPGGSSQEEPEGTGRNKEEPGGARGRQEEPGGERRGWEEPGTSSQKEPGGTRRSQGEPGGAMGSLMKESRRSILSRREQILQNLMSPTAAEPANGQYVLEASCWSPIVVKHTEHKKHEKIRIL